MIIEKHFYDINWLKQDKLFIKKSQKIFFNAFNTIMKLFFTMVYLRIITLIFDIWWLSFSGIPHLIKKNIGSPQIKNGFGELLKY